MRETFETDCDVYLVFNGTAANALGASGYRGGRSKKKIKKSLTISRKTITTGTSQILNLKPTTNLMNKKILLIIAVLASAALSAHAQNLVTNPGFESGAFDNGWINKSGGNFVGTGNAFDGTYSAYMGAVGSDGSFQQSIATSPGQMYNVSFYLYSPGGTPNDFTASFGGVTVYTITNAGAFPYTLETGNVTATGVSSLLLFSARQDPAFWQVDDVSVTAVVPEPGTLGLIALGALGLVGAVRKRRSV